jgi:hypothetical protein
LRAGEAWGVSVMREGAGMADGEPAAHDQLEAVVAGHCARDSGARWCRRRVAPVITFPGVGGAIARVRRCAAPAASRLTNLRPVVTGTGASGSSSCYHRADHSHCGPSNTLCHRWSGRRCGHRPPGKLPESETTLHRDWDHAAWKGSRIGCALGRRKWYAELPALFPAPTAGGSARSERAGRQHP